MSMETLYPGEGEQNTQSDLDELAIVDHSIDPATGEQRFRDEEPDTRIPDEDHKAEAMATSGKEDRDHAARYRMIARERAKHPDYDLDHLELRSYERRNNHDLLKSAALHDKEASTIEDWAGILHEHHRLFELAEGDMTLREIADHLKKMAQERANKMSREIQDTRTMIDEVYSGRAAEYTGEDDAEPEHHKENDQDHA
jgi:hypothetical protein